MTSGQPTGGPSRSVVRVADALDRAGASVSVVTSRPGGSEGVVHPARDGVDLRVASQGQRGGFWSGAGSPFGRAVREAVGGQGGAVVHDHGLWLPANRAAGMVAHSEGAPLVVSPKGMLSERSMRASRWKKRAAWHLYQRRALLSVAAFQTTSSAEAADVRRMGLRQPVAVIPHGVDVPPTPPGRRASEGPRTALFLSRIHPIKGLPDLIAAWGRVRPEGWRLVIAGPDEGGHRAEVERQVHALDVGRIVSFAGPVEDDAKWEIYGAADLFVLPSHSENFGIVVAEALGAGLPVITTRATPWGALETERCGWWVEVGADGLAAALREATAAAPETLRAMGERGRSYARARLSWARSGAEHLALYCWLLGDGPRPASVVE